MLTATFDSTTRPNEGIVAAARAAGYSVCFSSVSRRESRSTDFAQHFEGHDEVPELCLLGESALGHGRLGGQKDDDLLERILEIISNGAFPADRDQLSRGQLHQLRDALALEAHVASGRSIFVTADVKGFITHGRRECLQQLLSTRILSCEEFQAEVSAQNDA